MTNTELTTLAGKVNALYDAGKLTLTSWQRDNLMDILKNVRMHNFQYVTYREQQTLLQYAGEEAKGNKKALNGKVEKITAENAPSWIKSDNPDMLDKRAKDLRKMRYQTAQNAVDRDIRAEQDRKRDEQQVKDAKFQMLLDSKKNK